MIIECHNGKKKQRFTKSLRKIMQQAGGVGSPEFQLQSYLQKNKKNKKQKTKKTCSKKSQEIQCHSEGIYVKDSAYL
jgi:hypothetical protein